MSVFAAAGGAAAAKVRMSGSVGTEPIATSYRKDRKNKPVIGVGAMTARLILERNGKRHREAHPAAVPDLVFDGGAAPGHRARDQAGGRGLLGHERRGFRPSLLRRSRRARRAGYRAEGREGDRGLLRGGELQP